LPFAGAPDFLQLFQPSSPLQLADVHLLGGITILTCPGPSGPSLWWPDRQHSFWTALVL
jgi:hypothetical protein